MHPAQQLPGAAFMPPPDAAFRAKAGYAQTPTGLVPTAGTSYPMDLADTMLPPGSHDPSGTRHGFPGVSGLPEHYQDAWQEVPTSSQSQYFHWGWERKKEPLGKIEINKDREKAGGWFR